MLFQLLLALVYHLSYYTVFSVNLKSLKNPVIKKTIKVKHLLDIQFSTKWVFFLFRLPRLPAKKKVKSPDINCPNIIWCWTSTYRIFFQTKDPLYTTSHSYKCFLTIGDAFSSFIFVCIFNDNVRKTAAQTFYSNWRPILVSLVFLVFDRFPEKMEYNLIQLFRYSSCIRYAEFSMDWCLCTESRIFFKLILMGLLKANCLSKLKKLNNWTNYHSNLVML